MATDYSVRLTGQDNLTQTIKSAQSALDSFSDTSKKLDSVNDRFKRIQNSAAPLKKKLKDLQAIMAQMNLDGLSNTDVFTQLAAQAAEYKDAIADASQATRLLSSDTSSLDAGIQGFQLLTGVATVATGAMGLFGIENEGVEQAILKVQSALAMLNGVQTIANILNKDSILMLKIKQIQQIAVTAATGANTVAEGVNTAALGANTLATKAWNVAKAISKALLGDFTGLAIVGAGALLTYALCTSDATDEQNKQNESLNDAKDMHDSYTSAVAQNAGELVGKFEQLRTEWNTLKTDQEKTEWLEDNRAAFENLGLGIYDVATAENVFNNQTGQVIQALEARARAMAAMEAMVDVYKKSYEQKMANANNLGKYEVIKAGATNNDPNLTGEWKDLREGIDFVWKGDGIFGSHRELTEVGAAIINARRGQNALKNLKAANDAIDRNNRGQIDFLKNEFVRSNQQADQILSSLGVGIKPQTHHTSSGTGSRHTNNNSKPNSPKDTTTTNKEENLQPEYDRLKKAAEDAQKKLNNAVASKKPQDVIDKLVKDYLEAKKAFEDIELKVEEASMSPEELLRKKWESASEAIEQAKSDREKGIISKEDFEATIKASNQFLAENNLPPIEVKIEPKEGSVEAIDEEIKNIDKQLTEENLSIDARIKLIENKAKLQNQIDALTNGNVTIKAPVEPTYIVQGTIEDKRKSRQNAEAKAMQTQSDYEAGFINQSQAQQQFDDLNEELSSIGAKPIELTFDATGAIRSIDELRNEIEQLSNTFRQNSEQTLINWLGKGDETQQVVAEQLQAVLTLRDNMLQFGQLLKDNAKTEEIAGAGMVMLGQAMQQIAGDGAAAKAGAVIAAIGQIILGFAQASTQAISLGPFGWIAFVGAGLAAVATTIATIKGFADGGIIGGNSFHGDKIMARVNAGEMILNTKQQANLFRLLDSGYTGNSAGGKVEFKISGSTLKGVLRNYDNKMNKIKR